MARFSQWSPYERYVQSGLVDGQFLNAGFTMLAAGPPRLAALGASVFAGSALAEGRGDELVYPIGITQSFSLSHNRQFSRIFEIGSERSFFISGRTMGNVGLGRVLYHGPSLLRVMYAYYQDAFPPTVIQSVIGDLNLGVLTVANQHDVKIPPGYENFFVNLASDLFNQPVGMMAYLKDSNEQTYGACYMESAYIPNHSLSTDASGTIISENIGLQFERVVPIAVDTPLTLTTLDAADQEILGL